MKEQKLCEAQSGLKHIWAFTESTLIGIGNDDRGEVL